VSDHNERIVDQFTRQAEPFSRAAPLNDEAALQKVMEATGAGSKDTVLDVACGPGIVVAAFAPHVREATGIDLTPRMLERARSLAAERSLVNTRFMVGNVESLPFEDASFSVVISRLAVHHLERPGVVVAEMRRVCQPGGVVALVDLLAPPDSERAAAMNAVERLRDPSHARALPRDELAALLPSAGLTAPTVTGYELSLELESWLGRSFPDPADVGEIRRRFAESIDGDRLGLATRRDGGTIRFRYEVAICVSRNPR
jgi:ubiquinone/menaquinone biosynthesis C-methylase UbiE